MKPLSRSRKHATPTRHHSITDAQAGIPEQATRGSCGYQGKEQYVDEVMVPLFAPANFVQASTDWFPRVGHRKARLCRCRFRCAYRGYGDAAMRHPRELLKVLTIRSENLAYRQRLHHERSCRRRIVSPISPSRTARSSQLRAEAKKRAETRETLRYRKTGLRQSKSSRFTQSFHGRTCSRSA